MYFPDEVNHLPGNFCYIKIAIYVFGNPKKCAYYMLESNINERVIICVAAVNECGVIVMGQGDNGGDVILILTQYTMVVV